MKKIIALLSFAFLFTGVAFADPVGKNKSTDDSSAPLIKKSPLPLTPEEVGKLSYQYRVLVQKTPAMAVQVVRLSMTSMANLTKMATAVTYIFGADEANNVTLILGLYSQGTNTTLYYRYTDFFSNSDPGMSSFSVLCPPPGSCAGSIPAAQ